MQLRVGKIKNAPARNKAKVVYLLSGKIFCGHCGSKMNGNCNAGNYCYYQCYGKKNGNVDCKKKNIRKEFIERLVAQDALSLLTDEYIEQIATIACEKNQHEIELDSALPTIRDRIHQVDLSLNNLLKAIESGSAPDMLVKRMGELEKEKKDLQGQAKKESEDIIELDKAQVIYWLEQFRGGSIEDEEFCRMLIDLFVNSVTVWDEDDNTYKVTVAYNLTSLPTKTYRLNKGGTLSDFASNAPTMAALYAMAALRDSGLPLKRRIRILFGTNEETGSNDMKYYKSHGGELPVMGFTPDGEYPVINGEKGIINVNYEADYTQTGDVRLTKISGGSAPNVVPASARAEITCPDDMKPQLMVLAAGCDRITCTETADGFEILANGVSAHGASPELGINAIGLLMDALGTLPLDEPLLGFVHFLSDHVGLESDGTSLGIALSDEPSGKLTFNLGTIQGDETSFLIRINYRYPVTFTYDDCAPICDAAFLNAGFLKVNETHKACLYLPEDCELVQTLLHVYADETGLPAIPKSIGGGTYAKAIPNVVAFGPIFPGDEVREHKPDEFMEIDRLMENVHIFAEALYRLAR